MSDKILDFKNYLLKQDMSFNTVRNYIADIKHFMKWYEELDKELDLKNIGFYHLSSYRENLIHRERLKTASINRKIQALKRFFRFLVSKKIYKESPAAKIRFLKKAKPVQPKSLNKIEVHALLSRASRSGHGTSKRNQAIVQLILQTGIRISELLRLQYRDIDLYAKSGQVRVVDGKGHKERIIPLNSVARKAFSSYIEYLDVEAPDPSDYVFLSRSGKVPTARAIQKLISELARRANIDRIKVTPHVLRHTFATNYLRVNPGCLVELAALLGHESLDTTAVYTIASKERLESTLENSQFTDNV